MAKTTITGTGHRNNGGTILQAGNIASNSRFSNLAIRTTVVKQVPVFNENNSRLGIATRPLSGGTYNVMTKGRYICRYITGGYIAGVANTTLDTAAGDFNRGFPAKITGSRRLHITGWNAVTGAATKGGSAGAAFSYKGTRGGSTMTDTGTPPNPFSSNSTLVFLVTGKVPTTVSYQVITAN